MFVVYAAFVCLALAHVTASPSDDDLDAETLASFRGLEERVWIRRGWDLEGPIRMQPCGFQAFQIKHVISESNERVRRDVVADVSAIVERKLAENNSGYNLPGWLTLAVAIAVLGGLIVVLLGMGQLMANGAALLEKKEIITTIYMSARNQTCVICTKICSRMYAPRKCGHVSCCQTCIRALQTCPICSAPFSKTVCVRL